MLLLALLLCLRQDICRRCSLPAARCPLPYNFISIFLNIASAVSQSVVIFLFYLFSFILFFFSTRKKLRLSYFFLAYNTALAVIAFICRQYACICVCVYVCVQHSSVVPFCSPVRRSLAKRGIEIELDFSDWIFYIFNCFRRFNLSTCCCCSCCCSLLLPLLLLPPTAASHHWPLNCCWPFFLANLWRRRRRWHLWAFLPVHLEYLMQVK